MLAAVSLVGFYAWWGGRLSSSNSAQATVATLAVVITAVGVVCDFTAEGLLILRLTEPAMISNLAAFTHIERIFTIFSPGAANGLYSLGGVLLMLVTPDLPAWVRSVMWITWLAGFAMTVAALFNHVDGMVASTVVLFPLLILWMSWMGANWQPAMDER
jgi:hypothetical protein